MTLTDKGKIDKDDAGYRDMSPKINQHCDKCSMWRSPSSCTLVKGDINPTGWCRHFERKR